MKRISIDVIEDDKSKIIRVEAQCENSGVTTDSEEKMAGIIRIKLMEVLQSIPGVAGVGIGKNMDECRERAMLQCDIYRAGKDSK